MDEETGGGAEGKVTKIWWMLLIFPLGLIVGTITSAYHHLKADAESNELSQYAVSEAIDLRSLEDDMLKALELPDLSPSRIIKWISSSNGVNHYLKMRASGDGSRTFGYYDVVGEDAKKLVIVAVELNEPEATARAAQLGLSIAVMKSVFGESDLAQTLRFVFLPESISEYDTLSDSLLIGEEQAISAYLIRAKDEVNTDNVTWTHHPLEADNNKLKWIELSHPALTRDRDIVISDKRLKHTFLAAKQLRQFILEQVR